MTTAAAFIVGIAAGFLGLAWITAPERKKRRVNVRRHERADALREAALVRVTAERDALDDKLADTERRWLQALVSKVCLEAELRGQANPLPGVEPTPIADGLCFERWADEIGGAS